MTRMKGGCGFGLEGWSENVRDLVQLSETALR
jgi:hypothetical protein